ncbi:MAG TPA: IPT/TIG domain-containing protein [Bryobacteraceae bacterium]|nr:IPT/TIG domain-containing protein [Bryobacteraceae bacterium]
MCRARHLIVGIILCLWGADYACPADNAPFFTAAGVVQAATQTAGPLAPNTIATIYGTNLSWSTQAVTAADLNSGTLPTSLAGVTVYVNNMQSNLVYVSPAQINFLVPYEITATSATVIVARQGVAGPCGPDGKPSAIVPLAVTAPGFFEWNGNFAVAEHADGSLITPDAAAQPGEIVVLYATGLGRTVPDSSSGAVPQRAAPILYQSQLQILVNTIPLPHESVLYAGVTPGFAGLYQINVRLPEDMSANPQIQVSIGDEISPASVQLYAN